MQHNLFQGGFKNNTCSLLLSLLDKRPVSLQFTREMGLKVHSGSKKRFKVLNDGTLLFPHCNRRHMQSKKTHRQSARRQQYGVLRGGMAVKIRRLLRR
ncbi:hypothetical protein GAYE_PCTG10G0504 [Galdieria yellowstonensis]|uniref:50S ribosomal protein L35 n=1 Tax=Galdieria yellowstonensis TaxID=3028027 RepID=A0AAV9I694_9RHOD|nr:hypothetical protein GAYE_PCTG10G0504 [Galdieria yellowstonensis]